MAGVGHEELFNELRALELPTHDYAVFGSGPLFVRGIIPAANDLDVLCRGGAWDLVKRKGRMQHLAQYDIDVVTMLDGRLTFGTAWGIGNFNVDELIDSADIIAGLPFVKLRYVEEYKRLAGRTKDHEHLDALARSRLGT